MSLFCSEVLFFGIPTPSVSLSMTTLPYITIHRLVSHVTDKGTETSGWNTWGGKVNHSDELR